MLLYIRMWCSIFFFFFVPCPLFDTYQQVFVIRRHMTSPSLVFLKTRRVRVFEPCGHALDEEVCRLFIHRGVQSIHVLFRSESTENCVKMGMFWMLRVQINPLYTSKSRTERVLKSTSVEKKNSLLTWSTFHLCIILQKLKKNCDILS